MMLRYKHRYRKTDVHWHNSDKCEWDIWDVFPLFTQQTYDGWNHAHNK
jgi:hypothetical protein